MRRLRSNPIRDIVASFLVAAVLFTVPFSFAQFVPMQGGGSAAVTPPTGTGFAHVTSGAYDAASVAETGTGSVVRATSPTLVTPTLGAALATSINGNIFTTGTYTLTGVAGKTLTFNKSITLDGTDSTTITLPSTTSTVATNALSNLASTAINVALNTLAGVAAAFTATAPTQTASAQAGTAASLTASAAVAGSSNAGAAAGGSVTLTGGAAARLSSGNANGGDVAVVGGAAIGTGTQGIFDASNTLSIKGPTGTTTVPSIYFGSATTTGWSGQQGVNKMLYIANGTMSAMLGSNVISILPASQFGWTSTSDVTTTPDTGWARYSAGVIRSTNGSSSITGLIGGGAAVASATAMPLPTGTVFHVTGTTDITSITSTNFASGVRITLIFDGVLNFTDGSNLKLASTMATTADDTITLVYDGTNWYEVARSVN